MIRNILYRALNVISMLAIILALIALLTVVLTPSGEAPRIMGYTVMRVLTGSMEPALAVNSLVVVKQTDPAQIEPGEIVTFYSEDPALQGALNTHRVTGVEQTENGYVFTTKGDANVLQDQFPVHAENLVGVVVFTSAGLGVVVTLLTNPLLFIGCVAIPLIAIIIYNLYKTIRSALQICREEEQQAVEKALEELKKKQEEEQNTSTPQEPRP